MQSRIERGGFTLIELILVVVLISIMTSIVAPMWRVSPARRVENMAHLLATQLELARNEALSERAMIRVDFDVTGDAYVAYVDHDGNDSIAASAPEIAAFPAFGSRTLERFVEFGRGSASAVPGDATAGAVTLPSNQLLLSDQGVPEPWGTMGTIYLTHSEDNSAVAAISVASSGSFKAWKWDAGSSTWR
ncbi:MAG: GspH/FimT family pseudopilin [Gemmatimonadota bacterium]